MQIYHTSHCGSTLLVSLLSTVVPSYSEPSWCHKIILGKNIDFDEEIKKYKNGVIKLPSGLCHFAYKTEDKKIFLYRNLKKNLFKLLVLDLDRYKYINYYYEYFLKNIHPNLKNIEFDTFEKKHIFLWCNRIFWLLDSANVLGINSNNFFANKKQILDEVCDFLKLQKVEDFSYQNYNTKWAGLNINDEEISKVKPKNENVFITYPSYGIIEDAVCLHDEKIMELVDWAKNNISIPEFLL